MRQDAGGCRKRERSLRDRSLFFMLAQNTQLPLRKMGTVRPSSHTASMLMSAEPIIKSSCTMESLTPRARHSSSVFSSKPRMVSAKGF